MAALAAASPPAITTDHSGSLALPSSLQPLQIMRSITTAVQHSRSITTPSPTCAPASGPSNASNSFQFAWPSSYLGSSSTSMQTKPALSGPAVPAKRTTSGAKASSAKRIAAVNSPSVSSEGPTSTATRCDTLASTARRSHGQVSAVSAVPGTAVSDEAAKQRPSLLRPAVITGPPQPKAATSSRDNDGAAAVGATPLPPAHAVATVPVSSLAVSSAGPMQLQQQQQQHMQQQQQVLQLQLQQPTVSVSNLFAQLNNLNSDALLRNEPSCGNAVHAIMSPAPGIGSAASGAVFSFNGGGYASAPQASLHHQPCWLGLRQLSHPGLNQLSQLSQLSQLGHLHGLAGDMPILLSDAHGVLGVVQGGADLQAQLLQRRLQEAMLMAASGADAGAGDVSGKASLSNQVMHLQVGEGRQALGYATGMGSLLQERLNAALKADQNTRLELEAWQVRGQLLQAGAMAGQWHSAGLNGLGQAAHSDAGKTVQLSHQQVVTSGQREQQLASARQQRDAQQRSADAQELEQSLARMCSAPRRARTKHHQRARDGPQMRKALRDLGLRGSREEDVEDEQGEVKRARVSEEGRSSPVTGAAGSERKVEGAGVPAWEAAVKQEMQARSVPPVLKSRRKAVPTRAADS